MGFFEETVIKAKEVIDIASQKTNDMISLQKLKVNVASIREQMCKQFETLGRLVYQNQKDGKADQDVINTMIAEIELKQAELNDAIKAINAYKGLRSCPSCGRVNPADSAYCAQCGNQLNVTEAGAEKDPDAPQAESAASEPAPADQDDEETGGV